MADSQTLDVAPRSAKGKANKALRRSGFVPVHVYGPGIEPQAVQAEEKTLRNVIHQAGTTGLIKLGVDGKSENVMIRKVQRHPVSGKVLHVDFLRVRMDVKTRVRLPIQFVGEAPGVKVHDGVLPHHVEIDVSVLEELDQSLHVRDLVIPDKLTVLDDLDELIVKVQPPRKIEEEAVAEEEEAAAEGAAPAEEGEAVQPTAEAEPVEEKPQE